MEVLGTDAGRQTSASEFLDLLFACSLTVATAESLTGGLLVARLVDVPGASRVVAGGACTYSFAAKAAVLGLDVGELETKGAVRAEVAREMARAACTVYSAEVGLATTGVAGPGADVYGVSEGTVFIAVAHAGECYVRELRLTGGRAQIRAATVDHAIAFAMQCVSSANA